MPHDVVGDATARMVAGARRYAEADKSDPFALRRALAHIRSGVATLGENGELPYDATPATETRKLPPGYMFSDGGTEYPATVFKSVVRP